MKSLTITTFFSVVLSTAHLDAQGSFLQDTLAVVGPAVITTGDLLERIELMPWRDKEPEEGKKRALQSLAAERLLSLGARELNVTLDPALQIALRLIERLAVRDELYRKEVSENVRPTDAEIADGMRKSSYVLDIRLLIVASEMEGDSLYRTLERSRNRDSTISAVSPSLVKSQSALKSTYGDLDADFEKTVFGLLDTRISHPLQTPDSGWAVVFLEKASVNPAYASPSIPERIQRVEGIVRRRKEEQILKTYLGNVLSRHSARVDHVLFNRVVEALRQVLMGTSVSSRPHKTLSITSSLIDSVKSVLEPDLGKTLVLIGDEGLSVEIALEEFRHHSFSFSTLEEPAFKRECNTALRSVVEADIMTREGYRLNLQQSKRVWHDVTTWYDFWLAQRLIHQLTDTVKATDEQVAEFLALKGGDAGTQYEVNVREVLTAHPAEAADVLLELHQGTDLGLLAQERSLRKEWADRGGESGFFRVYDRPTMGYAALAVERGGIVGPLRLPEGYSVFRVIDKRKVRPEVEDADSLLHRTRNRITLELRKSVVERAVADLARRLGVTLYYEKLSTVEISTILMATRRSIGFGGHIQTAPTLYPLWEWARNLRKHQRVLP